MGWNGLDLVNDFAAELGDTSSNYKTKVLRWINDGVRNISTAHEWPFLRELGNVVLTQDKATHALPLPQPIAPVLTLTTGGSLTNATLYKVLVTFYEGASKTESIAGLSASVTSATPDLSITLSDIPVSDNPLVTARKVYVAKGASDFQYHGIIENNLAELPGADPDVDPPIPVTYLVAADPSSPVNPPEESAIFKIDGNMFILGDRTIEGTSLQNMIASTFQLETKGDPYWFAPINQEEVRVYPVPSSDVVASFYYFKLPQKVYGTVTSVPQMPSWIFETLRAYVIWRGYEYRDRAGKESKAINYAEILKDAISRRGKPIKRSGRVRVVTPDSDGYGL